MCGSGALAAPTVKGFAWGFSGPQTRIPEVLTVLATSHNNSETYLGHSFCSCLFDVQMMFDVLQFRDVVKLVARKASCL